MFNFHIADYLNRINNCIKTHKRVVIVTKTKLLISISKLLIQKSHIKNFIETPKELIVNININKLKYTHYKIISKPSKRIYTSYKLLNPATSTDTIISTNLGIMDNKQAYKQRIGGEILFEIK
ncbi:30S ribosomal protein S8 [Candidatus Vidania fulgoroideae]|uniref:Small ribosomal subunit protein uS8 n=1 Tax=Candidatus Vidania fulgoroideorum TaxID=881286 RepID=A0A974X744_9PROT|nr:30S ribosomal protein S8 [Candidatus Vidania fulgoroideae]